jgi:hypothetical protein
MTPMSLQGKARLPRKFFNNIKSQLMPFSLRLVVVGLLQVSVSTSKQSAPKLK